MKRSTLVPGMVSLALAVASIALAQDAATVRVTSTSVVVEQPRGDAEVVATLAPGLVLEVLEQRDEWYLVQEHTDRNFRAWRTGWIHQGQVEFLSGTPSETTVERAEPTLQPERPVQLRVDESSLKAGMVELSIDGSVLGASAGGDTETSIDLGATALFLVNPSFEVGPSFGLVKLAGADAIGFVGGVIVGNLRAQGPIVPFVSAGGAVGFGFPQFTGNPFVLDVGVGVRVMTPGARSAFVVQPFYERIFFGEPSLSDINAFGVSLGLSLFVGGE